MVEPRVFALLGRLYDLFRDWHDQGKMHPHYVLGQGHLHVAWLVDLDNDPNDPVDWNGAVTTERSFQLVEKLLSEHGYTIYRAVCAQRDAS